MDNKKYTQEIISQLSQLRDLLIVIERGGDKTPEILYTLAIEKSQQITSSVQMWRDEVEPAPVAIPEDYDQWLEDKTQEELMAIAEEDTPEENPCQEVEQEQEEELEDNIDEEIVETPQTFAIDMSEEEEEYIAPFVEDDQPFNNAVETPTVETPTVETPIIETPEIEEPLQEDVPEQNQEEFVEDAPFNDITNEEVPLMDEDVEVLDEEPDDEDVELSELLDDDFVGVVDDDFDEVEEYVDEEDDELYNRGEINDRESGTAIIGDVISAHRAKELRKALSLNDRFRFRRELFGNKDVEMNNTLNLIDAMADYAEAREYLLEDLGWSYNEPVVQEFLELVERHFKQQ